ncbi:SH3 domain-containing protein [Luteimonas sp. MC1828]|uniref:SH3 domain-containing protein n=1 Tax=Luteimonas sp. MC1828 TaxID=2799787 RepID=UPI0018F1CF6A|nr:SH3 domain-containing protein [Luteimonas sp. MC1828]MBJ7575668.1 SH3 domain-containing protein [Luteimonas sp. MC1828]
MDETELKRLLNQFDPLRNARDMSVQQNGITTALKDIQQLRDLAMPGDAMQRLFKEQREHLAALPRLGDSFADQFRQMRRLTDSINPSHVLGEAFMAQAERTAMARLAEEMRAPFESVRKLLLPDHSHIDEVIKRFAANSAAEWLAANTFDQNPIVAISSDEFDEQLVELCTVLANVRAAEAEGNCGLTWEQWLALASAVMTILMFWYQLRDSEAMEKRLSDATAAGGSQIAALIEANARVTDARLVELTAAIEELKPGRHGPPASQYAVIVDVLRVRAKPEGAQIALAHANQIVTVTDQRGRWLRVRYYDYQDARLVEGWCRKHHLQLIERIEA